MKHEDDQVIDLDEVKKRRRRKKRRLLALLVTAGVVVVGAVGWVVVEQVFEVTQPGDFWSNFSTSSR